MQTKGKANMKTLQCKICGIDMNWSGKGSKRLYCDDCKRSIVNQRQRERRAKNRLKSREYMREYMKKYYQDEDNRQKHLVRNATNRRIADGTISRATMCIMCGQKENLENHHFEYAGKFATYKIITLCKPCHAKLHKTIKPRKTRQCNKIAPNREYNAKNDNQCPTNYVNVHHVQVCMSARLTANIAVTNAEKKQSGYGLNLPAR